MTKRLFFALTIISGLIMTSCIHRDFDEPPAGGSDPDIDASLIMTIEDFKALYTGGDAVEVTDSMFISGVVTADDKSGNFYQTIVIEDASAGVAIRLETSDYNSIYPEGRRLFILVKGLYIGQYNGLVQVGVKDVEEPDGVARIPNLLVEDYFIPGMFGVYVTPEEVTIDDLESDRNGYQNRLIKLMNVEFGNNELGETYATDPDIASAVNRDIYDCENNSILLRNSSYAEFALSPIPEGNGSLTAIFSVFGFDNQLLIRNESDVVMEGLRCGDTPIECNDDQIAQEGIEEDFETAETFEPIDINNWKTLGVVGNEAWVGRDFSSNTYALIQGHNSDYASIESWLVSPKMDFDVAQTLEFESKIGYWKHDGLTVWISTDFDGCNVADATWSELTSAVIANSVNSPSGIDNYADFFINSGSVDLSSFSGDGYIGFRYVGDNTTNTTTYQVDNVVIGTPPPLVCDLTSLDEDFESIGTNGAFSLDCWENVATVGSEYWEGRSFSNNKYPQISGFNSTSTNIETYLISPPIALIGVTTLNFDTKIAFCEHEGLTVNISTDYDGMNVGAATWTPLNSAIIADSDCASGYAASFTNSGDVDISSFSGTGYIAFIYSGNNSDETTTYQVDNVVVD